MRYLFTKKPTFTLPTKPYSLYGDLLNVVYNEGKHSNLLGFDKHDNPYDDEFNNTWSLKDIWLLGWNDVKNA